MISLSDLADELATIHDVPEADMLAIVKTYAGQISDDEDLYDADSEELTDDGAEIVRESVAAAQPHVQPSLLDELHDAQADVDRQDERLSRRDSAIRKALAEGVAVAQIVEITKLTRARVYQIRDGRR